MIISKKTRENNKKCKQLFGGAVKEPMTTAFPTTAIRQDTSKKKAANNKCKQLFGGAVEEPMTTAFPTTAIRHDTSKKKAAAFSESDNKKRKEIFGDTVKDLLTTDSSMVSASKNKNAKKLALAAGMQALLRTNDSIVKTAAIDTIDVILNNEIEMAFFVREVGGYLQSTSSLKEYVDQDTLKSRPRPVVIELSPGLHGVDASTSNAGNDAKGQIPGIPRGSDDNVRAVHDGSLRAGYKKVIQNYETQPLADPAQDDPIADVRFLVFIMVVVLVSFVVDGLSGTAHETQPLADPEQDDSIAESICFWFLIMMMVVNAVVALSGTA
jgi:hypothetical protein